MARQSRLIRELYEVQLPRKDRIWHSIWRLLLADRDFCGGSIHFDGAFWLDLPFSVQLRNVLRVHLEHGRWTGGLRYRSWRLFAHFCRDNSVKRGRVGENSLGAWEQAILRRLLPTLRQNCDTAKGNKGRGYSVHRIHWFIDWALWSRKSDAFGSNTLGKRVLPVVPRYRALLTLWYLILRLRTKPLLQGRPARWIILRTKVKRRKDSR